MAKKDITTVCPRCSNGIERVGTVVDGELVYNEITCRGCLGSTRKTGMALDDDLIALFDDMSDKVNDIKEKVDEIKEVVDAL